MPSTPGGTNIHLYKIKVLIKKIIQINSKRIMTPEGFFLPQKLLMWDTILVAFKQDL